MNYEGERYAYCDISEDEKKYIENDVLVLKEALEMMFNEKHDKLTIGSCCLSEFKGFYTGKQYDKLFPDIRENYLDESITGVWNQWDYIHKAYHGGWCYANPLYAHMVVGEGLVYDVNSLYPSMMHSISGNIYPFGHGEYHRGAPSDELISSTNKYFFIRFNCRFQLKRGYSHGFILGIVHYIKRMKIYILLMYGIKVNIIDITVILMDKCMILMSL